MLISNNPNNTQAQQASTTATCPLEAQYDFLLLELFDQMVRTHSGGEMGKLYHKVAHDKDIPLATFIKERVGEDLLAISRPKSTNIFKKLTLDTCINKILSIYLAILYYLTPSSIRDEVCIRTSIGERHKWGYDAFSLARILTQAGFTQCQTFPHSASQIPHFSTYLLDSNDDGSAYKGCSSIYMEARA